MNTKYIKVSDRNVQDLPNSNQGRNDFEQVYFPAQFKSQLQIDCSLKPDFISEESPEFQNDLKSQEYFGVIDPYSHQDLELAYDFVDLTENKET